MNSCKGFLQCVHSSVSLPSLCGTDVSFLPSIFPLYPSQSQLWCMHEGGFPEDQRGHYPGAIRPLVEHVNECWVLLCFHMRPLFNLGRVEWGILCGGIKSSLGCMRFYYKYLYFYHDISAKAPRRGFQYSSCFPTFAREEVGSLIGAVAISCRLRVRGGESSSSGWNALTFVHERPRVPCGWASLGMFVFYSKGAMESTVASMRYFLAAVADSGKALRSCRWYRGAGCTHLCKQGLWVLFRWDLCAVTSGWN